jgi:hypothetical protein
MKLRRAYVSFLGFTVGHEFGTFYDAPAAPVTVEFEGPTGQAFYLATQLRYVRNINKWSLGAAIEIPSVNAAPTENIVINTQRTPDLLAYVQYKWKEDGHFRLGGIVRSSTYNSITHKKAYTEMGWGVQGSTAFNPVKALRLFGQMNYGKGISHLISDLAAQNIDLVPDLERPGRMQVLPVMGWYAGVQYDFTPDIFVTGAYSQAGVYKNYPVSGSDAYRYGQYLVLNTFWKVSPNLHLGAEYLRGWRTDFNNEITKANRASLFVQYSF